LYGHAERELLMADSPPFLARDFANRGYAAVGHPGTAEGWSVLTAVEGNRFVSPRRFFRLTAKLAGPRRYDYDIRTVGVRVVYGTLEP
jgi:hypothetical protein